MGRLPLTKKLTLAAPVQPGAKLPVHLHGGVYHLFANPILVHLGVLASWREFMFSQSNIPAQQQPRIRRAVNLSRPQKTKRTAAVG